MDPSIERMHASVPDRPSADGTRQRRSRYGGVQVRGPFPRARAGLLGQPKPDFLSASSFEQAECEQTVH